MEKVINFLIPKHRKLNDEEVSKLLVKYSIESTEKLPRIKISDPGLTDINVTIGDVVEITRNSFAGETKYYRVIIN